jgi:hypothetical protein
VIEPKAERAVLLGYLGRARALAEVTARFLFDGIGAETVADYDLGRRPAGDLGAAYESLGSLGVERRLAGALVGLAREIESTARLAGWELP